MLYFIFKKQSSSTTSTELSYSYCWQQSCIKTWTINHLPFKDKTLIVQSHLHFEFKTQIAQSHPRFIKNVNHQSLSFQRQNADRLKAIRISKTKCE